MTNKEVLEFTTELKANIRDGIVFDLSLEVLIDELAKEFHDNLQVIDLACELKNNINERWINEKWISGAAVKHLIDELTTKYNKDDTEKSKKENSLFGLTKGIICQQVNCCGVMGAGLAKAIMDQYPQVKEAFDDYYQSTINEKNKDYKCHYNQLGSFQLIPLDKSLIRLQKENDVITTHKLRFDDPDYLRDSKLMVANIYSQDFYGNPKKTGKIYTKIDKLMNSIKTIAAFTELPVYIPHTKGLEGKEDYGIGCGYGGEKWDRVYARLCELAEKYDNLYLLDTKSNEVTKVEPKTQEQELELD